MPGDKYPVLKVAAAQTAPVFLDRDATIDKIARLVPKAKELGADLVVFPESYIPTFPVWTILHAPIDQHDYYKRLYLNALMVPSPQSRKLGEIARANDIFMSVGCTEKGDYSMGAMWCTQLLFDRKGKLINRHRKLVPTWAEMLAWTPGDASDLRPVTTEIGKIGTLICGENTNTLARFALLAQGEQIHIATYPPAWPFKRNVAGGGSYDTKEIIRLRSAAHAFEGKVFVISSSASLDEDAIKQISGDNPDNRKLLESASKGASMVIGPTGQMLCEPVVGGEGFAVDASLIAADANKRRSIPGSEWNKELDGQQVSRATKEYLATLDDAAFGAASDVTPKFVSPSDPAARLARCEERRSSPMPTTI